MNDLRKDLIDFAGTLERHGDEDAAALVLRAGASIAELEAALRELRDVINAAGLINLSRGVQLGQSVWYVKAKDAMAAVDAALEQGE